MGPEQEVGIDVDVSTREVLLSILWEFGTVLGTHLAHAFVPRNYTCAPVGQRLRVFDCKCGLQQDAWFGGDTHSLSHISPQDLDLPFVICS